VVAGGGRGGSHGRLCLEAEAAAAEEEGARRRGEERRDRSRLDAEDGDQHTASLASLAEGKGRCVIGAEFGEGGVQLILYKRAGEPISRRHVVFVLAVPSPFAWS
jgi:hypothetical protein